jgi:KaiC/GvpD/RAD55 family RecA-like ATPase
MQSTEKLSDVLFDKYVRLCKTTQTKGELVRLTEVEDKSRLNKSIASAPTSDWYRSLYYYHEDSKRYFDEHEHSLAGYAGSAFSDRLLFDLDSESDLELAKKDTIKLLERLSFDIPDIANHVNLYFSGAKGFHVELLLKNVLSPEELKEICANIAEDLPTFDSKVYNTTRLIRLPNTKHNKSGLYKIELEPADLTELTIDQIRERAKSPVTTNFNTTPVDNEDFLKKYKEVKKAKSVIVDINATIEGIRGLDDIDFHKCPKHIPRCVFALSHGIMVSGQGERSAIFLRLAAFYRNQGMNKDVTYNVLKGISRLNAGLYPEKEPFAKSEIWNNVVSVAFNEAGANKVNPGGWGTDPSNDLLKKYCDAIKSDCKCVLHAKATESKTTIHIDDVSSSFQSFAENLDKNTVKTGIDLIDKNMKIVVGTTTLLVGACGSGKTSIALTIMENANALDQHTMFFSLDMHKTLVYLKLAQKVTSYTQDQVLNFFKMKDRTKIEEIRKAISLKFNKTLFDFSNTLTMEEMRDKVFEAERQTGNKIKLVVVDYASRVTGQFSDSYANARYNALKSTEVADRTDAAWIYLSQISRNAGDGSTPLRTKRAAKESGDWEESASNVLTVWRPFMGIENKDDILRMFLAKNRMGNEIERPLIWNGSKGSVTDMTEYEYEEYRAGRETEEKEMIKSRF